jgi:opacity protein-like surface antigen
LRIGNNTSNLSSPTAKGTMVISGSTNFSYSSMTNETKLSSDYGSDEYEYDANQFNFSPSIGWFVSDGVAIGININYESLKQKNESEEQKESTFLIGPSVTYYFGSSNIKPFILGEYMVGNYKNEYDGDESSTQVNGWGLGGGVAFFLNQHISLNIGLGYASMTGKFDETEGYDVETISKGINFDGGISVYF